MIKISLIAESHSEFGCTLNDPNSHQAYHIHAIVNTGAQTCSSWPEILKVLRCVNDHLVPTSHRICSITKDQLNIRGLLFMHISQPQRDNASGVCIR